MPCSVCSHPQCHDIDLAILTSSATLDALHARYGPSRSAIQRHKGHLLDKVDRAEARIEQNLRLTYLFQLNGYQEAAAATVATARAEGNARLTIQAANSGARILTAMARLETKLGRETTYRLLAAPEWVKSGCLLPGDPNLLTGPRRSLAQGLFSACPDADSDHLLNLNDLEEYLASALAPQDAAAPPAPRQLALPGFLTAPAPARQTQSSPGPRDKSEIEPKCRRDKGGIKAEYKRNRSGIKAAQTRPRVKNILQDQIDILNDKRSGTSTPQARQKGLPPAVMALLDESPTPAPENARLTPRTVTAAPSPPNAACVRRENTRRAATAQVHPAVLESAAPPAVSSIAPPQEPPDEPQETLDEAQAAELAAYLAEFPPYARQTPDPCPSGSVVRESDAPPALPEPTRRAAAAQAPDVMVEHPPPDFFITGHKRPASFPLPAAPSPGDPCSSGPELHLILSHASPTPRPWVPRLRPRCGIIPPAAHAAPIAPRISATRASSSRSREPFADFHF